MLFKLQYIIFLCMTFFANLSLQEDQCRDETSCKAEEAKNKYEKGINEWSIGITDKIKSSLEQYIPCESKNCSCHKSVLEEDLLPFKNGITKKMFEMASSKGTVYQIVNGKLYRQKDCHFPSRCDGVEHYLKLLAPKLPNMEFVVNTRDWPQINKAWGHQKIPVLSFSKTKDNYDIMYPAWSFWEGGPAISLYPTGIGRWDKHRISITNAAKKWPWSKKENVAFFRGSRTNEERDALILLSRSNPELVDAQYTKNQAWKSPADTLHAEPAKEVSFEDHCKYKYLFNYRGVAASFRFKHLFLCKSLVFHVGDEWLEFFYPSLKPWVHYVPISKTATQEDLKQILEYFRLNQKLAKDIAERGYNHIWENLTDKDVICYWRKLLKKYAKLLKYEVVLNDSLIKI